MSMLAAATGATKRFGDFVAVDGASVEVRGGEIVGLIGANGAGKTTLIRMLLGLLEPSAGTVTMFGSAPSRRTRRRLGYVPQGLGLWPDLTAEENLSFTAAAFGEAPPTTSTTRGASQLPDGVDGDTVVGALSLGQQRQLAFECALGHLPDLLVLDEPTSGVDPLARAHLWERIHDAADVGAGVLVTTHYMQEAQQCDRLVLMSAGRVAARGSLDDILGDIVAIEVETADWRAAFGVLTAADVPIMLSGKRIRCVGIAPDQLQSQLRAGGIDDAMLHAVPGTLEEAMLQIEHDRSR